MADAPNKLRVFVDANILIAGSVWPRWPYEILQHALRDDYKLILNAYVIEEARRTLAARFPQEMDRFTAFLDASRYEEVSVPSAAEVAAHTHLVRDLADVPVALAAITAGADCLISEDKDLTVRDDTTKELHQLLPVYLSGTFLREMMGWSTERLEAVRGRRWMDIAPPG